MYVAQERRAPCIALWRRRRISFDLMASARRSGVKGLAAAAVPADPNAAAAPLLLTVTTHDDKTTSVRTSDNKMDGDGTACTRTKGNDPMVGGVTSGRTAARGMTDGVAYDGGMTSNGTTVHMAVNKITGGRSTGGDPADGEMTASGRTDEGTYDQRHDARPAAGRLGTKSWTI